MSIKKKLKKNLIQLSKKNLMFRKVFRKMLYIYRFVELKVVTLGVRVDPKVVIFSCFAGESYSCSPKAIYEYMLNSENYQDYTFVWAFKNLEKYNEISSNKNTILVKQNSKKYKRYLATAKYWIFNYKIPEYVYPKKNQVFVQCWHGTPLKRLGCDLVHFDNQLNTIKGMKKRYEIEAKKFSYFISPSKYATEKFISAWNLKEIRKENIIVEQGYPRNDFLYKYNKADTEKIKQKLGIEGISKKIILYAPTYRSNQHEAGTGYVYKEEVDFEKLKNELNSEYIILFRAHYFIKNHFKFDKYKGFVYDVSEINDINELYIISDILVTDYSSVFFDYANLKRPMIFHMYDLEYYRDESNGFYMDLKELPGKITKTDEELIKAIKETDRFIYNKKYEKFNKKYNYLDDGQASERVVKECIK